MKQVIAKLIAFLLAIPIGVFVYGQYQKSVELDIYGRYGKQADYTTRFFGRSYTNAVKLWGKSFGVSLSYNHPLKQHLKLNIGIGYYKLGIDKISQTTPFNTVSTGRNIDYQDPSGIQLLFSTDSYNYDNLMLTGGFTCDRKLSKKWDYTTGIDLSYLYTFSQHYHLRYNNIKYNTSNGKILGFGINSYWGILRKINRGNYYINPKIILSLYQRMNGDKVFGEDNSVKMNSWINGTGLSITLGKYF
jgi:hypothetical protein